MAGLDHANFDIGYLDALSAGDRFVNRLDPRAMALTTAAFLVAVVSFDRYAVTSLIPFAVFPLFLIIVGDIPPWYLAKRVLIVSPFALMLAIFNPLLDRQAMVSLDGLEISGGWVSFCSIMLRFALTVGTVLAMAAATGFNRLCLGLGRMGTPRVFVVQMLLMYRYLFVLGQEAARMSRSRALRSAGANQGGMRVYGALAGSLLMRTLDRTERIYAAMSARGFDGELRMQRPLQFGMREVAFVVGWTAAFVLLRCCNISYLLGRFVLGAVV